MKHKLASLVTPWIYFVRNLPGPGVGNVAYGTYDLPPVPIIGPGTANQRQLYSAANAYVGQFLPTSGIGGLISGQPTTGPLLVRNVNQ